MATLKSPYTDADIETKDIGEILEDFMKEEWGFPTDTEDPDYDISLDKGKIRWGAPGTKMAKERINTTIRAYKFFNDIRDMALGGHKNDYFELYRIDVFVRDVATTTSRSPKLFKLLKHIETIFLTNKTGLQEKGISSVNLYNTQQIENPDSEDVYHGICSLEIRYVMDMVDV